MPVTGLKSQWAAGRLRFFDPGSSGNGIDFGSTSAAVLHGGGVSATPFQSSAVDKNFLSYYVEATGASGTNRGLYMRLYLSGGAGGEAVRAFTTVSAASPADTCNGAHISLNFGSSAGNITGLGTAARCTLHIPNRSLTGTTAAVQAEFYGDGTSSAIGGTTSAFRVVSDGTSQSKASVDTNALLFEFSGFTPASGKMIVTGANEPTWTGKTVNLKCKLPDGTAFWLVGFTL